MLMSITHRRCCAFFAMFFVILLQSVLLKADTPCDCAGPVALKTRDVCIDNTTYNVTVYGCNTIRTSAPLLTGICNSTLAQNQYTVITKVCFNGTKPAIIDAQKTLSAVLCAMSPTSADSAYSGLLPPGVGSVWCWTVMTPKCVGINQATGCIERCGTKCCLYEMRWTRTATGYTYMKTGGCTLGGECNQAPCEEIECPNKNDCCTTS
jgi:hypothetical protein